MPEDFVNAFAEFFSWLSGFTFDKVYTAIVHALERVFDWPFHWGFENE
jgi:hypothetical protein